MLKCEKCGVEDTTVTTVQFAHLSNATVGNICNHCKYELNINILLPLYRRANMTAYKKARKWIEDGGFSVAK